MSFARAVVRSSLAALVAVTCSAVSRAVAAQTAPAPALAPAATARAPRPVPGPVYELPGFTRAVERGTRARTGAPGAANWVQHARYSIDGRLDPAAERVSGTEHAMYFNNSPDTLSRVAVYLRQNVFAPGSPRRDPVPITGGVTLSGVKAGGQALQPITRVPRGPGARRAPSPGYLVQGTVMWIQLPHPILPGDSAGFDFAWSYSPAPSPSDGREGRDGHVLFMGYWYPQFAVYDDVSGWVTDPYLSGAEFYMDPADYDVRITVPRGWVVGATGTLHDPASVLSRQTLQRLAQARGNRDVVHVITPDERGTAAPFAAGSGPLVWHYTADDVRDFVWGTSDQYAWDATSALVHDSASGRVDTVAINSYFRVTPEAAAWRVAGARATRDAIEQLSNYLWPYPWPAMSSFEGVLTSGGMEYPMATLMQPWADTLSLAGDLMHETGHMWFPMQVGSNETRHPWMDEGLTQFDVAQGMRPLYGEPRTGGRPNDSEQGQRALYLEATRAGHDAPLEVVAWLPGLSAVGGDLSQLPHQVGTDWGIGHPLPGDAGSIGRCGRHQHETAVLPPPVPVLGDPAGLRDIELLPVLEQRVVCAETLSGAPVVGAPLLQQGTVSRHQRNAALADRRSAGGGHVPLAHPEVEFAGVAVGETGSRRDHRRLDRGVTGIAPQRGEVGVGIDLARTECAGLRRLRQPFERFVGVTHPGLRCGRIVRCERIARPRCRPLEGRRRCGHAVQLIRRHTQPIPVETVVPGPSLASARYATRAPRKSCAR